jgi:hypothetical protein
LGIRIANLRKKGKIQAAVEGLVIRAEDPREDVRVVSVLVDSFEAL